MKSLFIIFFCTLFQFHVTIFNQDFPRTQGDDCNYGDPLLLTPLIKCGEISTAREAARVRNWTSVQSYSGFFTVNETHNSNLFFWFFPADEDPYNSPVILWLQGGSGNPSFFGLFVENGPLKFDKLNPGEIHYSNHSWTQTHSVIYMDNPVGTGFSFTENDSGYAKNMDDVSRDLYAALIQFFILFPEFRKQDFFVGGSSYAGKYVPALAHLIHKKQTENAHWEESRVSINLKGIFMGAPIVEPKVQFKYAEFLFNIGLVDEHQRDIVSRSDEEFAQLIDEEKWKDAYLKLMETMLGGFNSYLYLTSGFWSKYNFLEPDSDSEFYSTIEKTIVTDWFRKAIHVGDLTHRVYDETVWSRLQEDIPKSTKPILEAVLNEGYRVLLYGGQLDITVPYVGIESLISSMNWFGKEKYSDAEKKIWRVNNEIAGFVKHADNLFHVLIRKAGHNAPHDQPEWCFDLINRFTREIPFQN